MHDCSKVISHGALFPEVEAQPLGILLLDGGVGCQLIIIVRLGLGREWHNEGALAKSLSEACEGHHG